MCATIYSFPLTYCFKRIQSAEGTGDDKLIDADVAELLGAYIYALKLELIIVTCGGLLYS